MIAEKDAIRYLAHQAKLCRDRDSHEAFTLLLPGLIKVMHLDTMDDVEAAAFRHGFKRDLAALADRPPGPALPARERPLIGALFGF
jgi:hypothetical protein